MPQAIPVKANGTMPYQYVTVETNLEEDRWVQAMEVRPGTRDVVHHILVFDVRPGEKDQFRGGTNGFFAAYVPGNGTLVYPPGYARRLRKGSRLVFQLHYTPSGKATEDRSQLGLIFAPAAPRHEVRITGLANTKLQIPPHADNYADHAQIRVPADVQLLSLMPHMHLRGKACRYETVSADGTVATLLDVPRYDFNWQLPYRFAEPPTLAPERRSSSPLGTITATRTRPTRIRRRPSVGASRHSTRCCWDTSSTWCRARRQANPGVDCRVAHTNPKRRREGIPAGSPWRFGLQQRLWVGLQRHSRWRFGFE